MANKFTFKVLIQNFVKFATANITELAKKELDNTDKKAKLDNAMKVYLLTTLTGCKLNLITKWVIEKYVINNIPVLTQAIYDLLKDKIKGVTK